MGEWSEYFEDFPEENPANRVNGQFDPKGAEALRASQKKVAQDQARLDAEIAGINEKHKPAGTTSGSSK